MWGDIGCDQGNRCVGGASYSTAPDPSGPPAIVVPPLTDLALGAPLPDPQVRETRLRTPQGGLSGALGIVRVNKQAARLCGRIGDWSRASTVNPLRGGIGLCPSTD